MMTNTQKRTAVLIEEFDIFTAYDKKRKALAEMLLSKDLERLANGEPTDDGLYGKVFELFSHDSDSTITRVQAQNRTDVYIFVDGKRKQCEAKTNGGRIGSLYKMSDTAKAKNYIVYNLDFFVKAGKPRKDGTCKPAEHRKACKVMTVKAFLQILEETGATKVIRHTDSDKEVAVQSDSKKLYKALITGGFVDYEPGAYFETWELQ